MNVKAEMRCLAACKLLTNTSVLGIAVAVNDRFMHCLIAAVIKIILGQATRQSKVTIARIRSSDDSHNNAISDATHAPSDQPRQMQCYTNDISLISELPKLRTLVGNV